MAKVKTYLEFINKSVAATKDVLERKELLHYMIGDTPGIDGDKAERDGITRNQVYELASYSTLMEVQHQLQELHDTGSVTPIKLGDSVEDDQDSLDIIQKLLSGKTKTKGTTITVTEADLDANDKLALEKVLKKIIKKIEEDK